MNKGIKSLLSVPALPSRVGWGLFLLRTTFALLMLPHGYSKFNQFMAGDYGNFPDPLGVGVWASLGLTVFAEFICSVLLLLGLGTRLALIPLIICMLVIVLKVHWSDPFGDKEHALLYLAGYVTLYLTGPGIWSLDERIFGERVKT